MQLTLLSLFWILPPLLALEALFSGAEIALLSADRLKLKDLSQKGNAGAALALRLIAHPEQVLSTTLLMTSLGIVGISTTLALFFMADSPEHGELYSILVASPLIVIFGELLPKTFFQRYAQNLAPYVAYPVAIGYYAMFPITRLLSAFTNRISRMIGPIEALLTGKRRTTREELRQLLSFGKRDSEIKTSEKRMIKRILDFKDSEAKHALIPLVKVDAIGEDETLREALERFQQHRHSRMPVYSERIDHIVGILEVSQLLRTTDLSTKVSTLTAPIRFVAETQSLEDVLQLMYQERIEMVAVVDEYGGAVGILTTEDIVEEVMGEIHDEFDPQQSQVRALTDTSWLVPARTEIVSINESLKIDIPEGHYETLSGFLLQQFGRIPSAQDELHFETPLHSLKFTIRSATPRQIELVVVETLDEAQKPV